VSTGGLAMGIERNATVSMLLDGDRDKLTQYVLVSGMDSSALEHSVPEQLWSTTDNPAYGISAVKALKIANDQGIPIYTINQTNIDTILPQLQIDADAKTDIRNAVNAGKEVTVSKTNITYNGWTGCGYIIIDPETGEGAYMISGGMSGAIVYALWWMGYIILLTLQWTGVIAALIGLSLIVVESAFISTFTAITTAITTALSSAATAFLNFVLSPFFFQFIAAFIDCYMYLTPLTGPPDRITGSCMAAYLVILYLPQLLKNEY